MKRMLSFLLATFLLITCVGCSNPTDISKESNVEQPKQENITTQKFNNVIDEKIFNYLENNCSYSDENYIFSPLSFKYALSLANYGANGTTQDELINATGFYNVENNLLWTSNINNFVKEYNETAQKDFEETHKYFPELNSPSRTISVANSIWHNLDSDGKIKDDYIKYSENNFNSNAYNVSGDKLMPEINKWVNDKTNGLIPSLFSQPLNDKNTILINALYLKAPWVNNFSEYNTSKKNFNGLKETKNIDFMNTTDKFNFYKDNGSTVVVLPLEGGINCALIMGNNNDIFTKIKKSSQQQLNLYIPKFEIETTFDNGELVNFLKENGVSLAFDKDKSDFSNLITDADISIDDIVQKAKIVTDEKGIEAAVVTSISFDNATAINPSKPETIVFDKPFKFLIYTAESQEILFFGNFCNP